MELLKQLLDDAKINVPDLNGEIKVLGYDPKKLTDEQVNLAFDHLTQKYKNNKPVMTKSNLPIPVQPIEPIPYTSSNLKTGIDAANAELAQIKQTVTEVANEVSETYAQEIYATIKAIPTMTLGRVKVLLDSANGDLTYFRKSPENLKNSLLSQFGIN